jgi:tetratricopeptide (TPR) repeat protein
VLELKSALQLAQRADIKGAVEHYRAALDAEPDLPMALNNLAWILATDPDDSVRNGAEAIKYADRACELSNFRTTRMVGTLAAAYAESGRYDEATSTAQKACDLATKNGDAELLKKNQDLLALYLKHLPYHEPAQPVLQPAL